jgi:hypothetical protein
MAVIVPTVVGVVIGVATSWALFFPALDEAATLVNAITQIALVALAVIGVALVTVVPLAVWTVRRFARNAHGTLDQVTREVVAATQAATEGNASEATSRAQKAVLEGLAWYGPVAARRWVVQTALGLLVAFGGLAGSALLFRQTVLLSEQNRKLDQQTDLFRKQNDLLSSQNEKLDQQTALFRDQNTKLDLQTITAEAQRRAGLSAELFSILQAVSLIERGTARTTPSQQPVDQVPRGLKARIVALSRAATPYRIIEIPEDTADGKGPVPQLAKEAHSPERGQLLMGLVLAGIDTAVLEGATFERADLREAILTRVNLTGAHLIRAYPLGAILTDANLALANLTGASLSGADLTRADLGLANLTRANLTNANLTGADLLSVDLTGAIVGMSREPGQLPKGFPTGWTEPPPPWELYDDKGQARLRRRGAPPASLSPQ